jgi:hypothetical protein
LDVAELSVKASEDKHVGEEEQQQDEQVSYPIMEEMVTFCEWVL